MDINIRAFGGEVQAFAYNFSPDPNNIIPLDIALTGFRNSMLGGATPVDPNLEGQYIDEFLLGYEYEVLPNFAIGVQGTYRELGQVIEDFLISPTTGYFIANPGQGIGSNMTFYDYESVAAPTVRREYTGIELNARKRYSNGWQLYASYLWSEARRQLRRPLPGLDRPARPQHQLGLRLRRLPDQRRRQAVERPHPPVQDQRQLHLPGRPALRPHGRRLGLLALGHAADRLRLLARLPELGVLPDAARLASAATRTTTRWTSTSTTR